MPTMGAGASAAEGRVFCHHCGARTASSASGELRCSSCGATDGVEATDQRLPTTSSTPTPGFASSSASASPSATGSTATSSMAPPAAAGEPGVPTWPLGTAAASSGSGALSSSAGPASSSTASASTAWPMAAAGTRASMRVESVTVVATQRPEDGGLLLRVLPNVVERREAVTATGDAEDWEATSEPACAALVSRLQGLPLSTEAANWGDFCVICAETMAEEGSPVLVLSCGHVFHEACIRRWLTRRHTCPTCRFELEVDNVKYLRSIGLAEEADALEKIEQEKQARELQKQAAARRRWVQSMRRGDPVHFGLVCGDCGETPLIGSCYRCTACEGYILCSECYAAQEANPSDRHPEDHTFVQFGAPGGSTGVPHGPGGQLTVLLPAPSRPSQQEQLPSGGALEAEAPGEAALAAAEAAFVAVRSLAFAPLAGASHPLILGAAPAATGSVSPGGPAASSAAPRPVGAAAGPARDGSNTSRDRAAASSSAGAAVTSARRT